jgi:peptide-methionine (R)-S-oxide reductase
MAAAPLSRRRLLGWLSASAAGMALAACGTEAQGYPVQFSEAQWRKRLTAKQFYILRERGTETPGTSPLLHEKRRGTFVCAADGHPLFSSAAKYDSHTGWPSFWQPLTNAIGTSTDWEVGYPRTEVHCVRCGGHLGHVFDDGPRPTGKRYCMNGDAMLFRAA